MQQVMRLLSQESVDSKNLLLIKVGWWNKIAKLEWKIAQRKLQFNKPRPSSWTLTDKIARHTRMIEVEDAYGDNQSDKIIIKSKDHQTFLAVKLMSKLVKFNVKHFFLSLYCRMYLWISPRALCQSTDFFPLSKKWFNNWQKKSPKNIVTKDIRFCCPSKGSSHFFRTFSFALFTRANEIK